MACTQDRLYVSGLSSPGNPLPANMNQPFQGTKAWIMNSLILTLTAAFLFASLSGGSWVQGKEVTYAANGTVLKGYIAYDDTVKGKRPRLLVVHE